MRKLQKNIEKVRNIDLLIREVNRSGLCGRLLVSCVFCAGIGWKA